MYHQSVLVAEVLEGLKLKPNENVIDGTLGGGGHARAILEVTAPNGHLVGIDQDIDAITESSHTLAFAKTRVTLIHASFANLQQLINERHLEYPIHAILFDLGVSGHHFEVASRGFSFLNEGPLDLRMNRGQATTAADIVNRSSQVELQDLFRSYGEEPQSNAIAAAIVARRKQRPFKTTTELCRLIEKIKTRSRANRDNGRRHPATLVFQALRIAVNHELEALSAVLPQALETLQPGGRLAVISFHSLEDREIKQFFRTEAKACLCPPKFPICQCHHHARIRIVNKKPIQPSAAEMQKNPKCRSAKLRIAEKI